MGNRKPRVYISGKITGTTDFMERFDSAEEKLKSRGYAVLNPAKANSYMPEDTTWDEYMKVSLTLLQMADAIYMQPEDISFASCEYAWTSFSTSAKTFYFSPFSDKEKRFHTSQKPIELYDWILAKYAKRGDKILDTHVGSASSLIACYKNGFDYIGFEKDPYYYELANKRLEEYKSQITLFDIGLERK